VKADSRLVRVATLCEYFKDDDAIGWLSMMCSPLRCPVFMLALALQNRFHLYTKACDDDVADDDDASDGDDYVS
jgi:hypothetical protein